MLPVNQVLQMGEIRKRLLWSGIEEAIWIDIDLDSALPEQVSVLEVNRLLIEGELVGIADPFADLIFRQVEEGSVDQQKRDAAWSMLADIVDDPQIFIRTPRGPIIKGVMERHSVTKQTVYRLLRRLILPSPSGHPVKRYTSRGEPWQDKQAR